MKKRYIVILALLAIYVVVMLLALGKDLEIKSKDEVTLIVGDKTIWKYSEESWLNITREETINSLNWLDYNVYIDNKKIGNYYLWHNDNRWYIFDKNKNAVAREGSLLAYQSNYDIKIKEFTQEDIKNYHHVTQILEKNNLIAPKEYTTALESTIDIDNDGTKETFYFVSNAFSIDDMPDKVFSFVFMEKNKELYQMYSSVDKNDGVNGCKPYLKAVIDIDEDNTYEIIVSCARYSDQKPVDMLYKLTEKGFEILISNQ